MTIRVQFDGRVFVPEVPVHLPAGQKFDITLSDQAPQPEDTSALQELADELSSIPANPDWPEDGAAQIDHYLYGIPKRP